MKTLVVVNPQARGGEVGRGWADLEAEVRAALGGTGDFEAVLTAAAGDVSRRVRAGLLAGVERVVIVGGDGTLSEGVQGFFADERGGGVLSPRATLGVLPAGRGDDFFKSLTGERSLSSAHAWDLGLHILREGRPRAVDVGRIRWLSKRDPAPRFFINIASFGYPGLLVQKVHLRAGLLGRSRLGKSALAYLAQSVASLREYRPIPVRVSVDGAPVFEGPIFSGLALNGYYNAGGVRWSRDARLDDGELGLLLMEPRGPLATARSAPSLLTGDWRGVPGVHVFSGRKIRVEALEDTHRGFPLFEVDGDQPEPADTQGAEIDVLPGVLNILSLSNS